MKKQFLAIFSVLIIAVLFTACGAEDMKNDMKDNMSSIESAIDNPSMQNNNNDNSTINNSKISADEAKSIALKHAGLKEDEVTFVRSELERDDGILKYEVDFNKGMTEYDYDINAETGEIISYDQDID